MKKPTTPSLAPTIYSGYILRPRPDGGADLIAPNGYWASFPTARYAKWSATFLTNINTRFTAQPPLARVPEVLS